MFKSNLNQFNRIKAKRQEKLCYYVPMIGSLRGKILLKKDKYCIVEAGEVGYKIYTNLETLKGKNEEENIFLWIYSHIREESFELYGFTKHKDLDFFEMMIKVPGIGPKGAITILSMADENTIKKAIKSSDINYLTQLSGIGKKTAQKMVLELKDKIEDMYDEGELKEELDTLLALKTLGYNEKEARNAIKEVKGETSTNGKIREALKILSNK